MADEVKKNEEVVVAEAQEAKAEAPKEPTLEELKAMVAKLEAEKKVAEANSEKQKKTINNVSSDAAEWKRKYRETLDENTRKEQEQAEKFAEMQAKIATYEAERRESTYFAKLIDAGYDPDTAKLMASGLPENVADSFFEAQKAFLESKTKAIKAQTINAQPNLPTGSPLGAQDAQRIAENKERKLWGLPPLK